MDNLDGLIERLRDHADAWDSGHTMSAASDDLREAATTLETLTQENARLREALERIAARNFGFDTPSGIARKALGGGDE